MISNIQAGPGVMVNSTVPSMYINMSNPLAGTMRYNQNHIEVYDGQYWVILPSQTTTLSVTHDVYNAVQWALKKQQEEYELELLANSNPVVKDLIVQMNAAMLDFKEKIRLVKTLIKQEESVGGPS
jgi:hypothetical protein